MLKRILTMIVICLPWVVLYHSAYAAAHTSPIGYWKTIDDITGKPKAIVEIWQSHDKLLYGRVAKIYPRPGVDRHSMCKACKGDRHNKHIVTMTILEKLKQNKKDMNEWIGGKILDPKTGKVYNSTLKVVENGQKLRVRGYMGLPLFGRSQTWVRVDNQSVA